MTFKEVYVLKDLLLKLSRAKFKDPKKSYSVFKFFKKINEELYFLTEEIEKIKSKYLDSKDYKEEDAKTLFVEETNKLLLLPIEKPPDLSITIEDVLEAEFPDDKSTWLNASDYGLLTDLLKE